MQVDRVVPAGVARPFGDERTVQQAFPSAVPPQESDPFLMCDYFNAEVMGGGVSDDPDHFPVDWHPHRGMDILSYLKSGVGRHGDSLGNRETYATPGMQWMSVGSGVMHAEGGGTPRGQAQEGFQIWINVPAANKMDDPSYGTEPPEAIPQTEVAPGARLRLLAGPLGERRGAFLTKASVQIVDFELEAGGELTHTVPAGMDTALLYVYSGTATVNVGETSAAGMQTAPPQSVVVFDAASAARDFSLACPVDGESLGALLFAGKRLREPIAWHGPIVMSTQQEVEQTFHELRTGRFPPVRVPWDYRRLAAKPR